MSNTLSRQILPKKRSFWVLNRQYEEVFNALRSGVIVFRHPLGALTLCICLLLTLNLHGCGQVYRDGAQHQWLVNFARYSAVPVVDVADAGLPQNAFVGTIQTRLSGKLLEPELGELSGLASSSRANTMWAINDSGNSPVLYEISQAGVPMGRFALPFPNVDWESLDRFQYQGQSWLLVADTGDNLSRRKQSVLVVVAEPKSGEPIDRDSTRRVIFSYVDGPQNVESVAVSERDNAVYFVSKRASSPVLFSLPLDEVMAANTSLVASRAGEVHPLYFNYNDNVIERLVAGRWLLGPTGFDIGENERFAVVANYRHVYLFRKRQSETWAAALTRKPDIIADHRLAQSESVAFTDADKVIVGSEGVHAPLLTIDGQTGKSK